MCRRRDGSRAAVSRNFEVLFVEAESDQLPLWESANGARRFGGFIVAATGHGLPNLRALLGKSMRH